ISGNTGAGVLVQGAGPAFSTWDFTDANRIVGNYIGTSAAGDLAVPNTGGGVTIQNGRYTIVGEPGGGNLISGNGGAGIQTNASTVATSIQSNRIGTNAAINAALANGGNGIFIDQSQWGYIAGNV